jgi:hypothetical protein
MRRLLREVPRESHSFTSDLLSDLVQDWGNDWSSQREFLTTCLRHVRATRGPVLQCGAGLSTLLIGAVAQRRRLSVWTLEHDIGQAARVQGFLDRYGLHNVRLCVAPLRSYGDFDWYEPPNFDSVVGKFSLVICDGPAGETFGGSYSLLPILSDKLSEDCTFLLDDGTPPGERRIASRWARMLGASEELLGSEKPFVRLRAGQIRPSAAA